MEIWCIIEVNWKYLEGFAVLQLSDRVTECNVEGHSENLNYKRIV